jgi:hypothetical protein
MTQRLDPPGPARAERGESQSSGAADQRIFPRIRFAKGIEISIGQKTYAGQTYDISQGGLSFIASDAIANSSASIRIADSAFVFQGRILSSHSDGQPDLSRFHFQFSDPLSLATLAALLGT